MPSSTAEITKTLSGAKQNKFPGRLLIFLRAFLILNFEFLTALMITERDITVWIISALLATGIGWSRYAKWKTHDKIVRELAAMDPDRREKMLSRMNPKLAMEMREQLMKRFRM